MSSPSTTEQTLLSRRTALAQLMAMVAGTMSTAGCAGYQIGNRSLYRPDVRSVHVPIATSDSFRRFLGERLTESVIKQIELRTPYKVVSSDAADSVLTMRVVSENKRVVAETINDDARDIETEFFIQISWVDRRGDLIMNYSDLPLQPLLVNIGENANFVPEGGQSLATAQQEAIHRLATQVVDQMEQRW